MDAAPPPSPAAGATSPQQPGSAPAWPRCAQLATAFLLGLATALVVAHGLSLSRWGTRPTELHVLGPAQPIDLNHADRSELLQLPGVGEGLAERIERYRQQNGPFRSVRDLTRVQGIGPRTLERLAGWVCVRADNESAPEDVPRRRPTEVEKKNTVCSSRQAGAAKAAALKEPVNLNRATAEELTRLPGIGPKLSQRIVDERRNGPFKSV